MNEGAVPVYFHRVRPSGPVPSSYGADLANVVTAKAFDAFLEHRRERLVDANSRQVSSYGDSFEHVSLMLTFDDAYQDFADVVLPRLECLHLRTLLFVVPAFADGKTVPAEYRLTDLLERCANGLYDNGVYYPVQDSAARTDLYRDLWRDLKRRPPSDRETRLSELARDNGLEGEDLNGPALLDWSSIEALDKHPCVEIGAHTLTHPFLPGLSAPDCWREIAGAKRCLEERLGHRVRCLAYPYGDRKSVV